MYAILTGVERITDRLSPPANAPGADGRKGRKKSMEDKVRELFKILHSAAELLQSIRVEIKDEKLRWADIYIECATDKLREWRAEPSVLGEEGDGGRDI
jgi:hypothetical protein